MSLSALPWLTRSEARPAARLKTCELAKHKSQQDETDLFIYFFFFLSFCLGGLTLLLSWSSVPKERESSAVSVGTLEPLGCVWGVKRRGDHVVFWWGWGVVMK